MSEPLTAQDLWPLVEKLPHDEQVRLAKLALQAAARAREAGSAYAVKPPTPDELGSDDEPLAWDAEGWDELGAAG